MSTPCRIAIELPDHSFRSITCSYDGYPDGHGVGKKLLNYYTKRKKVDQLIEMGHADQVNQFISVEEFKKESNKKVLNKHFLDGYLSEIEKTAEEEIKLNGRSNYNNNVCVFYKRDMPDEYNDDEYNKKKELFPHIQNLIDQKISDEGIYYVPYTYFFGLDNEWYGIYHYNGKKPIPLNDFEGVLKFEEEIEDIYSSIFSNTNELIKNFSKLEQLAHIKKFDMTEVNTTLLPALKKLLKFKNDNE